MKGKKIVKYAGIAVLALLLTASFADSSWAIGLRDAKASGLVGERGDGYLGAVGAASAEVRQLIRSVNSKRKSFYQSTAAKTGASLASVESRAGVRAVEKTPKGQFIMSGGRWVKK